MPWPFKRGSRRPFVCGGSNAARSTERLLNSSELEQISAKLKENVRTQDSRLKGGTREATYADLRYTKFTIDGFQGPKHAVFVPDSLTLTEPILRQICIALDKEVPSLLLMGMGSITHCSKMSTPQLRKCPGFKPLLGEAYRSLPSGDRLRDNDKRLVEIVNRVLEKKVASAVGCLGRAAVRTNVWTLTLPQITSLELFLQQSIEAGDIDIFRMAVAHVQDRAYMESKFSKHLFKELYDNSQEMSPEGVSYFQPILLQGDLWDPSVNDKHPEFAEHGMDHWSFDAFDQQTMTGHPLTLWPWPHANLFLLFYHEEQIRGVLQPEVDWQFKTIRRLDHEAIPFDPALLAPTGYAFFGAPHSRCTAMKKRVLQAMRAASPVVLLDNTPNVAKQLSLAVSALRRVYERAPLSTCRPFLDDAASAVLTGTPTLQELLQALSPGKILKYTKDQFDQSGMDTSDKLTLTDIMGLLDLMKRRPQAFREMIVVLDPLMDNPEKAVPQMMAAFTSHHTGLNECNNMSFNHSLMLKAWGLHAKLTRTEVSFRRLLTATMFLIFLALSMSTAIAMLMVSLHMNSTGTVRSIMDSPAPGLLSVEDEDVADIVKGMHVSLISLPIAAALLMIIQNNFQVPQKWAGVHMAACRVVCEIYYFLASVGPYNESMITNQKRFQKRLSNLAKCLSVSGLPEEDVMGSVEEEFAHDADLLQRHVDTTVYGIRPQWWIVRQIKTKTLRCLAIVFRWSWTSLLLETDQKDLTAPVTAEMYMESRMVPLKVCYLNMLRRYTCFRNGLHMSLMLLLGCCILLGVIGLPGWIPVAVSWATCVGLHVNWAAPPEVFNALNSALGTLGSFDLKWQGTDIRESRSQNMKESFVTSTEKIALNVARSLSRATLSVSDALPEGDSEDDSDNPYTNTDDVIRARISQESGAMSGRMTPLSSGMTTPLETTLYKRQFRDSGLGA